MARYKPYELKQDKFIPLSFADQVVPGSFEYALNEIVEEHLDLRVFEKRYRNDQTGRLAYDPKVLLKIVLYGYSKGIISSRKLEEACRRNVVFMALSAPSRYNSTYGGAGSQDWDRHDPASVTWASYNSPLRRFSTGSFGGTLLICYLYLEEVAGHGCSF